MVFFDKEGNFIKKFKSVAGIELKIDAGGIRQCCWKYPKAKTAGGYQWCFSGEEDTIKKR